MSNNNDHTIITPNPGGRRYPSTNNDETQIAGADFAQRVKAMQGYNDRLSLDSLENPVLAAANDILSLSGSVAVIEPVSTAEQLRQDIENKLIEFETLVIAQGQSRENALTAQYILCCLVDEIVLNTPWGNESHWAQLTLLSQLHNETSGGEKFFLILEKLQQQPQHYITLIELCYVCLSLGFAGKYRIAKDNGAALAKIKQQLVSVISRVRGDHQGILSPHWQGLSAHKGLKIKYLSPWWSLVLLFILTISYFSFFFSLRGQVEPVYKHLADIAWEELLTQEVVKPADSDFAKKFLASMANLLQTQISNQKVTLATAEGFPVLVLQHPSLFASGSAKPNGNFLPDQDVIKSILTQYKGTLLVIGHTDSTGKADSNWTISLNRANAIKDWLDQMLQQPGRIHSRGVADTQPLVSNDTAQNRSKNRRVEIVLLIKGED